MRAFVQTLAGVHLNTQGARAQQGFRELGVECVEFLDDEDLEDIRREDVLVAGKSQVMARIAGLGIVLPDLAYPGALFPFLGRRVWKCEAKSLGAEDLPVFLRPCAGGRAFRSVCAFDEGDLAASGVTGEVWASEVVWFQSTWRCFVRYGEILATLGLEGDPALRPDLSRVSEAIRAWDAAPAGCAVDFGVDERGRTLVVRGRDAVMLGPAGLGARQYALLLAARWAELAGTDDPLRHVPVD